VLYLVALKPNDAGAKAGATSYLDSISETCWHEFDGIWFLKSDKSAVEMRDDLKRILGPNHRVAIAHLTGFAAWHGFDDEAETWLLRNL